MDLPFGSEKDVHTGSCPWLSGFERVARCSRQRARGRCLEGSGPCADEHTRFDMLTMQLAQASRRCRDFTGPWAMPLARISRRPGIAASGRQGAPTTPPQKGVEHHATELSSHFGGENATTMYVRHPKASAMGFQAVRCRPANATAPPLSPPPLSPPLLSP